jgi:AcrR family transcriptional regulator
MSARGPYAKGLVKRREIIEAATRVVARRGYRSTTIRDIADEAGLSQAGLLHYFSSKDALLTEVVRADDASDPLLDEQLSGPHRMTTALQRDRRENGLVSLYVQLVAEAVDPDHVSHEFFRERFARLRAGVATIIRRGQREGTVPAGIDPDRGATLAIALTNGLRLQSGYAPDLDLVDLVEHLWELLGIDDRRATAPDGESSGPGVQTGRDAPVAADESAVPAVASPM